MKNYVLKYNKPAEYSENGWQNEVLPIGNGMLGMCVFGGVSEEHLQFNEKTLWTGGPSKSRKDYIGGNVENSFEYLEKIRDALCRGDKKAVLKFKDKLVGIKDGYGAYQNFGEIVLKFPHSDFSDYERQLDITNSVCTVKYKSGGVLFARECFASQNPSVIAEKITADKKGALNTEISFLASHETDSIRVQDNSLILCGRLSDNDLAYYARLCVTTDGEMVKGDGKLVIKDASYLVFALAAGTNYKNEYPNYRGELPEGKVNSAIDEFLKKGYDEVKKDAIAEYKSLFDRFSFEITSFTSTEYTDKLLSSYRENPASKDGRYLEELLCQYGRYLLISSSAENDELPANLQGVWNNSNLPAWSCDYHLNVNLQMCYWHAYVTGLFGTAKPMIRYMESLREPGRITARCYHNIVSDEKNPENGWVCHTQNTPFGWTCPGWDFYWGWSPAASSWMMQNCFDYYAFTEDTDYLRSDIYPMMKENAVFWLQNLVYSKEQDRYVSSPSYSPEHGPISIGNTYEQTLIWQLFTDTEKAARVLGDDEFAAELEKVRVKLKPITKGRWGQIKEWYEEDEWYKSLKLRKLNYKLHSCQNRHRHASHLLGLYPGNAITDKTPELIEACKVSLLDRGFGQKSGANGSGWGKANKVNLWARAKDGNRAYSMLRELINKNIAPNLWDFHPPYQMDGNCGYTSGVCEMLCYSSDDIIELLPALPEEWKNGSVKGLCARGGYSLDFTWENGEVKSLSVHSSCGKKTARVKTGGEIKTVETVG